MKTNITRVQFLVSVFMSCTVLTEMATADDKTKPENSTVYRVNRDGELVTVTPPGISFRIPQPWLAWHNRFQNNLHLTKKQLAAVKSGDNADWDPEYALVVNSVLPFGRCALHAGREGWGSRAVSYADLQMRVYVIDKGIEKVQAKIAESGTKSVRLLFTPRRIARRNRGGVVSKTEPKLPKNADQPPKDMKVPITKSKYKDWRQSSLSYQLFYGDYGAKAHVDFRLRPVGDQTLAVVFMYTNFSKQQSAIQWILDSFAVKSNQD